MVEVISNPSLESVTSSDSSTCKRQLGHINRHQFHIGGQKSNLDHEIAKLPPANECVDKFQSITVRQIGKHYRTFPLIAVTVIITPESDHISI